MPAKFWRVFLCPDTISKDSIMRLENLFITQDYGVYTPENQQIWQTLCKRQTDALEEKA